MKRRELREHLFKMVFIFSFNLEREMDEQIDLYLDGIDGIREEEKEYLKNRYYAVHEHIAEIDELLDRTAKGWSTDRFASADLAILRVACYEMLFDENIPEGVAINEAVEIAKIYGGDDSPSFINGILGNISAAAKSSEA
ncbi:MAG TPA: transcription antitermination factor NusB [Lachnospiraceae bacterium]|nr:transcription antitermination factor NusB [Lachnospiraceae bacterium]HAV26930.1 transcription antitermination factor NusB [Lachnospiraceae bacterium]